MVKDMLGTFAKAIYGCRIQGVGNLQSTNSMDAIGVGTKGVANPRDTVTAPKGSKDG